MTAEHERALMACALTDSTTACELLAIVAAPMIADGRLQRVWSALRRVLQASDTPGSLLDAVAAELAGDADDVPSSVPSTENADYYARRVVDAYVRREAASMIGDVEAARIRNMTTADLLLGVEARARGLRERLLGSASDRTQLRRLRCRAPAGARTVAP